MSATRASFDIELQKDDGNILTTFGPNIQVKGLLFTNIYELSTQKQLNWLKYTCSLPRQGFINACTMIMKLRSGGLCHAGPPCGSFTFINAATHGRRPGRPMGLASLRKYVLEANRSLGFKRHRCIARYWTGYSANESIGSSKWPCLQRITARMSLLLLLCVVRGCYFCIEQPTNSCMYRTFPYVMFLQKVARKLYKWTSINLCLGGLNCICCEHLSVNCMW